MLTIFRPAVSLLYSPFNFYYNSREHLELYVIYNCDHFDIVVVIWNSVLLHHQWIYPYFAGCGSDPVSGACDQWKQNEELDYVLT